MSVVIRGMKMPASCQECQFNDENMWCLAPGDWHEKHLANQTIVPSWNFLNITATS